MEIAVPYVSLSALVTFLATEVCTAGIEKIIKSNAKTPIKINRVRVIIFLNFLIRF